MPSAWIPLLLGILIGMIIVRILKPRKAVSTSVCRLCDGPLPMRHEVPDRLPDDVR